MAYGWIIPTILYSAPPPPPPFLAVPAGDDSEGPGAGVGHPSQGLPFTCHTCGKSCKRHQDLERHLKATRRHSEPGGPACPMPGCKFTARFTRVDNFRVHYKKRHGKSVDETKDFLQRWARERPQAHGRGERRAPMRKRKNTARTPTSGI